MSHPDPRIHNARQLRKTMTPAEVAVWQLLRAKKLGHKFRRQHPIGPYIVDFVCLQQHLVIELDGAPHVDLPEDHLRDSYLRSAGFRVLRVWNDTVGDDPEWFEEVVLTWLEDHTLGWDDHPFV